MKKRTVSIPGKTMDRMRRDVAEGANLAQAIDDNVDAGRGVQGRVQHWKELRAAQLGMNVELWDLLNQPGVTDVLINGSDVWVDEGTGLVRARWAPSDAAQCRLLATQMAAAAGKRLDDASPIVDAFLGESVRLHAVLAPLANPATVISLRVLRPNGLTLKQLVDCGTVPLPCESLLLAMIERRISMMISGATGSGKTTLLAALLGQVAPDERIVCIEEVTELFPNHPHIVHLQERQLNIEGSGSVTLSELVRAAMRMRPDRIVLGECRGPEVRDVLLALNTGHDGGFATIHANSAAEVPARLVALGTLAGLSDSSVHAQALAAFQVVLHLQRHKNGPRRLVEVGVFADQGRGFHCVSALCLKGNVLVPGKGLGILEQALRGHWAGHHFVMEAAP